MPHFIISSHGRRLNNRFRLPANCELHFYTHFNRQLDGIAYPLFDNLIRGLPLLTNIPYHLRNELHEDIIIGGHDTDDYQIWNGNFLPYVNNQQQNVNGLFRLPYIFPINNLNNTTLGNIINIYNDPNAPINIFHCLFCRT